MREEVVTEGTVFAGRVGLQQRVLPAYRTAFVDRLAEACAGGLSLLAGEPRPDEAIATADTLRVAHYAQARNLHLMRGRLYVCVQLGLMTWLSNWDPEALILEANPRYLANWRAIGWMRDRRRPVLGWGLGSPPFRGVLAAPRRLFRRAYLNRFDALIAYSGLGAEQYRAIGVPPARVFVALNAVSPPPPPLGARPVLEGRPARILFVGRLQQRKRVDLLLRACAALEAEHELWVVGDGPARPALEELAAEVCPQARFTGAQHGAALGGFFDRADLFVLPGTGGLAVQEAMGHGLPVIVAEGDGTQNDMVEPDNGWLVPSDDLDALSQALAEALSDPARLRRMGAASHRIVTERVNIDAMAAVFVRALNAARRQGG
jgi:glycosyltransferase involved in cell wall biosynthesis